MLTLGDEDDPGAVCVLDPGGCRFESVHCAQKAKAALNGADIYAGCCTLKIEYARVSEAWQRRVLLEADQSLPTEPRASPED